MTDIPLFDQWQSLPTISSELWQKCSEERDFGPVLYEYYRYTGIVCISLGSLVPESPALRAIPPVHFAVLTGLICKMAKHIKANMFLCTKDRFGETTALIDRCIAESAIKVHWLCKKDDTESFTRYLADGLKMDLKFKAQIKEKIVSRGGSIQAIEQRMLRSIDHCISTSGLTEDQIQNTKDLPNLFSMFQNIGLTDLHYSGIQRLGSHRIHGTWTDLITFYIEQKPEGKFQPQGNFTPTHQNQLLSMPLFVLNALKMFLSYVAADKSEMKVIFDQIDQSVSRIQEILDELSKDDVQIV